MEALCFIWVDKDDTTQTIIDLELSSMKYSITGTGEDIPIPFNDPYYIPLGYNNRVVDIGFIASPLQNSTLVNLYTETIIKITSSTSYDDFPELKADSLWTVSNVDSTSASGSCGYREYSMQLTHRGNKTWDG